MEMEAAGRVGFESLKSPRGGRFQDQIKHFEIISKKMNLGEEPSP